MLGGKSRPPFWALHRVSLLKVKLEPFLTPKARKLISAYREQLGSNAQRSPIFLGLILR